MTCHCPKRRRRRRTHASRRAPGTARQSPRDRRTGRNPRERTRRDRGRGCACGSGGVETPRPRRQRTRPRRPVAQCEDPGRAAHPGGANATTSAVEADSRISPARARSRTPCGPVDGRTGTSPSRRPARRSPCPRDLQPPARLASSRWTRLRRGWLDRVREHRHRGVAFDRRPDRRPPWSSTLRSTTSCISASSAGTRGALLPQRRRIDESVSSTVATPVGVWSSQPARNRSTSSPGVSGGGPGRSTGRTAAPPRAARRRLGDPVHSAHARRRAPVSSVNAVAARLNTSLDRDRRCPAGDLGRAEPRRSPAARLGQRYRRGAEVDEHDPTARSRIRLAGLTSPCTMPCWCSTVNASAAWAIQRSTVDTAARAALFGRAARPRSTPSTHSSTSTCAAGVEQSSRAWANPGCGGNETAPAPRQQLIRRSTRRHTRTFNATMRSWRRRWP